MTLDKLLNIKLKWVSIFFLLYDKKIESFIFLRKSKWQGGRKERRSIGRVGAAYWGEKDRTCNRTHVSGDLYLCLVLSHPNCYYCHVWYKGFWIRLRFSPSACIGSQLFGIAEAGRKMEEKNEDSKMIKRKMETSVRLCYDILVFKIYF